MDEALTSTLRRVSLGEIELAIREWSGDGRPFLLVHGLASNALTWDLVARRLNRNGHRVIAVDQRGHGQSDKPETGYGFDEVTSDLSSLIQRLGIERPIVAGQSWGGNVVIDFAARYPDLVSGLVLVDGGLIDLSGAPGATWEQTAINLKPPNLLGTPRQDMISRMQSFHPAWDGEQIELQMANYETLEDGTIRPWLTLDRHMEILRSLWDQKPSQIFERLDIPVLIAIADSGPPERRSNRIEQAKTLEQSRARVRYRHFQGAAHDIHVDQPDELTDWVLAAIAEGFFD